ncbi:hypothetical protein Trydic_g21119 [Trypoxylus dichotomus]
MLICKLLLLFAVPAAAALFSTIRIGTCKPRRMAVMKPYLFCYCMRNATWLCQDRHEFYKIKKWYRNFKKHMLSNKTI